MFTIKAGTGVTQFNKSSEAIDHLVRHHGFGVRIALQLANRLIALRSCTLTIKGHKAAITEAKQ